MKYTKIVIFSICHLLINGCCSDNTKLYLGYNLSKNDEIRFVVDGNIIYEKKPSRAYNGNSPKLIGKICSTSKGGYYKIDYSIGIQDTTIFLPIATEKIGLGKDLTGKLYLATDKDKLYWALD